MIGYQQRRILLEEITSIVKTGQFLLWDSWLSNLRWIKSWYFAASVLHCSLVVLDKHFNKVSALL